MVEPGHCFEWAWLFEIAAPWLGPEAIRLSDGLVELCAPHTASTRSAASTINETTTAGVVHNGHARLWPQTERLKAALARYRRTKDAIEHDEAIAAYRGLTRYLEVPQARRLARQAEDGRLLDRRARAG